MRQHNRSRRDVLRCAGAAMLAAARSNAATGGLQVAGQDVEIQITTVSPHTFRLTVTPVENGRAAAVPTDGSLVTESFGKPTAVLRGPLRQRTIRCGDSRIEVSSEPLAFTIRRGNSETVQKLAIDKTTGAVSFPTGDKPLLALGEGGPQFDRRGSSYRMRSGQGGYQLRTHGGRVPIPWIIGTGGWALFFHHPFGTFDFTGAESKFAPREKAELPLDIFFVNAQEPVTILAEYARLTGHPEMPPLWSFGYHQSHRTISSREEVLGVARTFREKKLPCDSLIYLGTGFCPSGWNTNNGEFTFNRKVFPDPKEMFDEMHREHFKVSLHVVIRSRSLHGTVADPCDPKQPAEQQASCYWAEHRPVFALGVDGWWPDEGDPLDAASRLARNRMYWEGPQLDRPNERPFALHRNAYAGMQRYAPFLWSGDVYSTWDTLRTHIPIAVNTGLSGIPYWGTDIGGFVPTHEFTAELYLRWFQFGAFCTLFRCHGRTWKLRLPWGWDTGDPGPVEVNNYNGASTPDPSQLHNPQVEAVCRKYLELRYRMLPYLYSAVREGSLTGMPVMRALWLHYPDDPAAVARGDEYLWGRDVLVAPVVEQGAASRKLYLPRGAWYDFWTGERQEGGREITRAVDLETMPLYVRAGSILPLGPVKQYTSEPVDEPLEVSVYPGADASFLLYEDDGSSFRYRNGEWMGIQMNWNDGRRRLSLRLARGSRMLSPGERKLTVKMGETRRSAVFDGRPAEVQL
ncbi:MAG TPA: TIM-barrel domain-containing protein [Bryobacteraceae bacterium]|nr:TIM-barrel domain-containing protein [Bryobacteraceae bacterium]